jgi:hypothetical protein
LIEKPYTAYETFDNEVERDLRIADLMRYKDKKIKFTNVDDLVEDYGYILKYTIEQL